LHPIYTPNINAGNAGYQIKGINMSLKEVNGGTFQKEVLDSEIPVLVEITATWCQPCIKLLPILEQIAEENTNIKIVKIDTDDNYELSSSLKIRSVPTLILFKNGRQEKIQVGMVGKEAILKLIG
jgi:thioredoxin 1